MDIHELGCMNPGLTGNEWYDKVVNISVYISLLSVVIVTWTKLRILLMFNSSYLQPICAQLVNVV